MLQISAIVIFSSLAIIGGFIQISRAAKRGDNLVSVAFGQFVSFCLLAVGGFFDPLFGV